MTPAEAAADIIATYAQTPKHLTGPPVVNWAALVDGDLTDAQLMGVLAAHPARPLDVVRAHNTRARKARARDIKALADKYQVSEQSIRAELPRPRVSSVTGGPVPTWPEAWEMVRDTTGEGPHTPATVRKALEDVGKTNVQYHINSEAYPWWVKVKVIGRTEKHVRRQITIGTGEVG